MKTNSTQQPVVKVLLFTASRHFTDKHYLAVMRHTMLAIETLAADRPVTIICRHGASRGGDTLFKEVINKIQKSMQARGITLHLDPIPYFRNMGLAGGPERNKAMVYKDPRPDLCLSMPLKGSDNKGTLGCTRIAREAGIEILSKPLDIHGNDVLD